MKKTVIILVSILLSFSHCLLAVGYGSDSTTSFKVSFSNEVSPVISIRNSDGVEIPNATFDEVSELYDYEAKVLDLQIYYLMPPITEGASISMELTDKSATETGEQYMLVSSSGNAGLNFNVSSGGNPLVSIGSDERSAKLAASYRAAELVSLSTTEAVSIGTIPLTFTLNAPVTTFGSYWMADSYAGYAVITYTTN